MSMQTIYRTEAMATRALAAEIRHDHRRFVSLLEREGGRDFGRLHDVQCEVKHTLVGASQASVRVDVQLEFEGHTVGIEAKLDHELTAEQVDDQLLALGDAATLFILLPCKEWAPEWLPDYPGVSVIDWKDTLASFDASRLTLGDIEGEGRLLKTTVEARLRAQRKMLDLPHQLPGWVTSIDRGDSGMPSLTFRSPTLPDGKQLRGQLEVTGRRMPPRLEDVRFNSYIGISVDNTDPHDFPDPTKVSEVPRWVEHLRLLHATVLDGQEGRLGVNRGAPGNGRKHLGIHKLPLATKHLGRLRYLAKGYTTWAVGPKTNDVSLDQLPELADNTVEIFRSWYDAEVALGAR
ncbi:hypothetical protein KXS11_02765 [Plantibacter flavus]|uniref:hypothetical protein n=1 Tax=Plantibacter flavus TaxID=150123 RepID=UPI003F14AFEA